MCENDIKTRALEIQQQILDNTYNNTGEESRLIGAILGSVIGDALGHQFNETPFNPDIVDKMQIPF